MKYVYSGDSYMHSKRLVEFGPVFKQFHSCKAAIAQTKTENGTAYMLVSYETPIVLIHKYDSGTYNVWINESSYRCSNTTIHQLSRFLNEYFGEHITYAGIKHNVNRCLRNNMYAVWDSSMVWKLNICLDSCYLWNRIHVWFNYLDCEVFGSWID